MLATELIIEKLKEVSGFKNCAIVTQEGLSIDSYFTEEIDKDFLSAITFSMYSEIEKQSKRIGRNEPKTSIMETDANLLAITTIPMQGESFVLFSEFSHDTNPITLMDSINKIAHQ